MQRHNRMRETPTTQGGRKKGRLALPILIATLGGCDIPTAIPSWETRWTINLVDTEFGVGELLPAGVTISPDGEAFLIEVPDAATTQSLRSICPSCSLADGLMVPKPAFNTTAEGTAFLPHQIRSAELEGGTLRIRIRNEFTFDPLRPPSGLAGSLALTLRSEGEEERIVAEDFMRGETDAMPPGTVVTREVPLAPGSIDGDLRFDVQLVSPKGGPVRLDLNRTLGITADFVGLRVSSVRMAMNQREVSLVPMELDLGAVDRGLLDRLEGGILELEADNRSAITLDMTFEIRNGSAPPISWEATLPPGISTSIAAFSAEELRSILERDGAVLTGTGKAGGMEEEVELRANQRVILSGRMDLGVRMGGS